MWSWSTRHKDSPQPDCPSSHLHYPIDRSSSCSGFSSNEVWESWSNLHGLWRYYHLRATVVVCENVCYIQRNSKHHDIYLTTIINLLVYEKINIEQCIHSIFFIVPFLISMSFLLLNISRLAIGFMMAFSKCFNRSFLSTDIGSLDDVLLRPFPTAMLRDWYSNSFTPRSNTSNIWFNLKEKKRSFLSNYSWFFLEFSDPPNHNQTTISPPYPVLILMAQRLGMDMEKLPKTWKPKCVIMRKLSKNFKYRKKNKP